MKTIEEIDAEIAKCKEERKVIQDQINKLYEDTIPLSDKIAELTQAKHKLQGSKLENYLQDHSAITCEWLAKLGGIEDPNVDVYDFAGVIEIGYFGNSWEATIPGNDNFLAILRTKHDVVTLLIAMRLQDKLKIKDKT